MSEVERTESEITIDYLRGMMYVADNLSNRAHALMEYFEERQHVSIAHIKFPDLGKLDRQLDEIRNTLDSWWSELPD